MFERILVPLDGSGTSEMVVPYAVELASMFNSNIVITGVSDSYGLPAVNENRSYLEKQSDRIKEALIRRQPPEEEKPLRAQVSFKSLIGNPAAEILSYATSIDSSLIIIASRGASGGGSLSLGSVADKILRSASCPVLLIRESIDMSAVALKYILRKILVPLDGSKLSEEALPLATGLAKLTGAEIVLFQVTEPVNLSIFSNLTPEAIKQYNEGSQSAARDYLDKITTTMIDIHSSISVAMGERPVAEMIIDYSEINQCDLITISTNGRSGISRWVFGSVTDKVLHAGKKPVLVVRPKL
jgi:nucleotide-binding universal stress UspA family protein